MPIRSGTKRYGGCWSQRSHLERILICVLSVTILILVVLLVLVAKRHATPPALNTCSTPTCLREAGKIVQQIYPSVNPCDDFHQFACGNFLKNSHGDEHLNFDSQLEEQAKRELLEMYAEDIRDDDHKMVKTAKQLFRKCMNQTEIEMDNLNTIKQALKETGGWPVLEGPNWDERRFDWFRATYKLRQLGYPFSFFLDLRIQPDRENNRTYIFKVVVSDTPDDAAVQITTSTYTDEEAGCMHDIRPECDGIFPTSNNKKKDRERSDTEYLEKMIEVVVIFGTPSSIDEIRRDMNEAYDFWQKLKELSYTDSEDERVTVDEFQQSYGKSFEWLRFINVIAGPIANVSKKDFVLFQSQAQLKKWMDLVSQTSKRILANYMMWRVVEKQLPYLPQNLQNLVTTNEEHQTRIDFCLSEISKRFNPNPIEIMWNKKYLPVEKKKYIKEIIQTFKLELLQKLEKDDWIEQTDRQEVVEKVKNLTVVIGQPDKFYDDKILDYLEVDMIASINTETFLGLLAKINRNHQSRIYNRIQKSTSEALDDKWYYKYNSVIYDSEDNILFMPTMLFDDTVFSERRPNYMNYGYLAIFFNNFLVDLRLSIVDEVDFKAKRMRSDDVIRNSTLLDKEEKVDRFMSDTDNIPYEAYEKWVRINGEEQVLTGLDYTPRQLFWISGTVCQTANSYSNFKVTEVVSPSTHINLTLVLSSGAPTSLLTLIENTFSGCYRNSPDFVKDFNCVESKTSDKCKIS